jgi:hypothetical protein
MKHLTRPSAFLTYNNEAVLPFYILHQTVIVTLSYAIVRWPIPDLLKFHIVLLASFAIVMVIYEYLVRRINLLRFLFGMKLISRRLAPPVLEVQTQETAKVL